MFVPLIYAPVLPVSKFFSLSMSNVFVLSWRLAIFFFTPVPSLFLVRIALRKNPVLRDRLFYGVLAGAFAHGLYLMYPSLFQSLDLVDSSLSSQICIIDLNRFNSAILLHLFLSKYLLLFGCLEKCIFGMDGTKIWFKFYSFGAK